MGSPTQSSGWSLAKGDKLEIELSKPLIKYEFGPADQRSFELGINANITHYTDGSERLRVRHVIDDEEKDSRNVTLMEEVFETEGEKKQDKALNATLAFTMVNRLDSAGFYDLKRRHANDKVEDGDYQRIKIYGVPVPDAIAKRITLPGDLHGTKPHEVILKNFAFPKDIADIITVIRSEHNEQLNAYKDTNPIWTEKNHVAKKGGGNFGIGLPRPMIKYECGPSDKRALDLSLGVSISYHTNGSACLRHRYLIDDSEKYRPQLTIIEEVSEIDSSNKTRMRTSGLVTKLRKAGFYDFSERNINPSPLSDEYYQRLKVYGQPEHETLVRGYAFPEHVADVIKTMRVPFEKDLGDYSDMNKYFKDIGWVLDPQKKTHTVA